MSIRQRRSRVNHGVNARQDSFGCHVRYNSQASSRPHFGRRPRRAKLEIVRCSISPSTASCAAAILLRSKSELSSRGKKFELVRWSSAEDWTYPTVRGSQSRSGAACWLEQTGGTVDDYAFPGRIDHADHLSTRQYARLVDEWVTANSLRREYYGTHSLGRTKAAMIYKATGDWARILLLPTDAQAVRSELAPFFLHRGISM